MSSAAISTPWWLTLEEGPGRKSGAFCRHFRILCSRFFIFGARSPFLCISQNTDERSIAMQMACTTASRNCCVMILSTTKPIATPKRMPVSTRCTLLILRFQSTKVDELHNLQMPAAAKTETPTGEQVEAEQAVVQAKERNRPPLRATSLSTGHRNATARTSVYGRIPRGDDE